jgi:hypothetical protein
MKQPSVALIALALALRATVPGALVAEERGAEPAAVPGEAAAPLADFAVLTGSTWHAEGEGFSSTLTYRWQIEGHVLEGANELRNGEGAVIGRYRGSYAWDAGRNEVVYWMGSARGEVHRGRAWWRDGVLWHEAEVSGGKITTYASAVRPTDGGLEYYADYGAERATPELLAGDPLVYRKQD